MLFRRCFLIFILHSIKVDGSAPPPLPLPPEPAIDLDQPSPNDYLEKLRFVQDELLKKYHKAVKSTIANRVLWSNVCIRGWPESVTTVTCGAWQKRDLDTLIASLPEIEMTDKNANENILACKEMYEKLRSTLPSPYISFGRISWNRLRIKFKLTRFDSCIKMFYPNWNENDLGELQTKVIAKLERGMEAVAKRGGKKKDSVCACASAPAISDSANSYSVISDSTAPALNVKVDAGNYCKIKAIIHQVLLDKYREAMSAPSMKKIVWKNVKVVGWPEELGSTYSSKWKQSQVELLYNALPSITMIPLPGVARLTAQDSANASSVDAGFTELSHRIEEPFPSIVDLNNESAGAILDPSELLPTAAAVAATDCENRKRKADHLEEHTTEFTDFDDISSHFWEQFESVAVDDASPILEDFLTNPFF